MRAGSAAPNTPLRSALTARARVGIETAAARKSTAPRSRFGAGA
jgi:hypothetical protein